MLKDARHIFKLDPAKEMTDEDLEKIAESGTDLILVGGTDGITEDNVLNALARVRRFSKPVALEVTDKDSVIPGFDHYFIPSVFNTTDIRWQHGLMLDALKEYSHLIDYDEMSLLPYLIMNEDCKAFKKSEAEPVTMEMLPHYVDMIDKLYKTEYLYIEYSGMYGDPAVMETVKAHAENTHVIYGGGISSKAQAEEMAQFADTIVVGNIIHDDVKKALRTIIN
ncbi:heptaprenylglyceryl phosphate synthase [Lacicoccus alkaliphilus]|uniref:Putative glycerol-1-phosphate prenyltransferase n=1 Tax=Lacicoccus alkaliphilus DSM 16010 TaxID=1123231 RepID=A0A1M7J983_9BACL|nr:heptaprenylglyceryl phosphate synthase [Salinicoccus alkaliphilus]SHM49569.1 putative glycerol-1-phosphate prenyltransferase [Salinicoccus alkaliphilus DSM 16010]